MTRIANLSQSGLRRRAAAVALAVLSVATLAAAPALGASAISILVNDRPITSYDIQQRTLMVKTFTRGREGEQTAKQQLIDEQLMLQEAKRVGMEASDAEVDAEIASRARGAKLTAAQFQQAMRQAGFDPQTFRDFVRANLAWTRIVRARFQATVNITDLDVAAALTGRESTGEEKVATEYLLQEVIFVLPPGSGAGLQAERQKEAAAFRSAFQGCDQAIQQAKGSQGVVVKPQVRREEGRLPAEMQSELAALDVGGITKGERVPEGIRLIAVCAKNQIAGATEAAVEARQEMSSERGQLLARRYLRDLRSDAVIEYR